MKRKNYYLIWCVLFIFLIMPLQFGCEEAEDELQQEQTAVTDFDPWIYDFNCNGQIDKDEVQAVLDDYTENNINETEFEAFTELWISLNNNDQEENSEKSDFNPCSYDSNSNGVIDLGEAVDATNDFFDDKITLAQAIEVVNLFFDGENVCNNAEYYWDWDYGTTPPALLAKGDNWVLLYNDIDAPDYDEQTIYDDLFWACKTAAKPALLNYWVKEKLLGSNIVKFLAKDMTFSGGVISVIKHFILTIPTAGDADEINQVHVRESDGYTTVSPYSALFNGSTIIARQGDGYFETATTIHHGYEWYDYKLELYQSVQNSDPIKLTTAILPYQNCGLTSTLLIWDYSLNLDNTYNYAFYSVKVSRKSPGASEYQYKETHYISLWP